MRRHNGAFQKTTKKRKEKEERERSKEKGLNNNPAKRLS